MSPFQTRPYMLKNDEGRFLQTCGGLVTIKATSEQTSGRFNLFQVCCPPGFATPLHIHYVEDVAIYVLEGRFTLFWGSEKKEGDAGSYFFQPRGTPHGFRVKGNKSVRILYATIPAGLDRFVLEYNRLAVISGPGTVAARYKIELLGPLPD